MSSELVELPNDVFGMALNLEEDNVGIVLFGISRHVKEGDLAKRTGKVLEVSVGKELLGRVVNPLGQSIDGKGTINSEHSLPVERKALGVMQRQPVTEPLQTGIKSVDSMIPIGRGQRELILEIVKQARQLLLLMLLLIKKLPRILIHRYIVSMLLLVRKPPL